MFLAAFPPVAGAVGPAAAQIVGQLIAVDAGHGRLVRAGIEHGGNLLRALLIGPPGCLAEVAGAVVGLYAQAVVALVQPAQHLPDVEHAVPELHALHAHGLRLCVARPRPPLRAVAVEPRVGHVVLGHVDPLLCPPHQGHAQHHHHTYYSRLHLISLISY